MIASLLKTLFGSKNERELKRMGKLVARINALAEDMAALSDAQLGAKTAEFKGRLGAGESLDQILPEAFAAVREASNRTLGLRHFDVQLVGGIALHEGKIAEMRTGEGKTLVATLPAYLNALGGDAVHLVTVNDYLATRDAAWMGPIYTFLGLSVGAITSGQPPAQKRAAYAADIIYGTNNEFGFDYLRDNMAFTVQDKMQGRLAFAIVDEVDSILIDEARTPLIISGAAEDSSDLYRRVNRFIHRLDAAEGHYTIDEKLRQVELTEAGHQFVEELLTKDRLLQEGESLYAATNLGLLHHVHSALRAHLLFHKDVQYIVQRGQVVLIDEHTGRTTPGRRLSEGLHQAIEAKEGVAIQSESQTLASTTFQNYFRLYGKLAGMTGTADTEAFEFRQIYGLQVVVVPPNVPTQRQDLNDLVFLSVDEKYAAIVEDVKACIAGGAPVLVGTASIETSEEMSRRFKGAGVEHQVLNAKFHEQEAGIIAQAGVGGTVTIATNMAGRGTDIVLGGNWEAEVKALEAPSEAQVAQIKAAWQQRHDAVVAAGGLHIFGTERHESRRIDNQLRGRAGRQGDPGVSRFYLSMEDNLMRIFASERVKGFMQSLGMGQGEAIEHRMVTNSIEKAQRKVEARNFEARKHLLEYDDVANDQRRVIYSQRNELLEVDDIAETVEAIIADVVDRAISDFLPPMSIEEQWDIPGLERHLEAEFAQRLPLQQWLDEDDALDEDGLRERIQEAVLAAYRARAEAIGPDMRKLEKQIMLQVLDTLWKEHLAAMDHLRQGIHLRAYAQKNPKQEYKRESFELFQDLLDNLQREVVRFLCHIEVRRGDEVERMERQRREAAARERLAFQHAQASGMGVGAGVAAGAGMGGGVGMGAGGAGAGAGMGAGGAGAGIGAGGGGVGGMGAGAGAAPRAAARASAPSTQTATQGAELPPPQPFTRGDRKVGRNEPCPCGSGEKYKRCHGRI